VDKRLISLVKDSISTHDPPLHPGPRRDQPCLLTDLPPGKEVVVVGSSRAAADDFVRSLAAERGATLGQHRLSLVQFAVQIARGDLAQRGFAPLTATGAAAIAVRAVFEVRKRGELKFFEQVADKSGFATALANTVRELRASGIESDSLKRLGARGSDLATLLAEYRTQLDSAKLADVTDVFAIATERVEGAASGLATLPVVLLDVQLASKAETRFIAALAAKAPEVFATIIDGDTRTSSTLRGLDGNQGEEQVIGVIVISSVSIGAVSFLGWFFYGLWQDGKRTAGSAARNVVGIEGFLGMRGASFIFKDSRQRRSD